MRKLNKKKIKKIKHFIKKHKVLIGFTISILFKFVFGFNIEISISDIILLIIEII